MKRSIAVILSSAALAASSGLALADQHRHEPRAFSKPTERVEARLAYVKTALKITDAQQSQWNAFADAERRLAAQREAKMSEWRSKMQEHRKDMAENKGAHEHHRPSAIERLDFAEKMHANAIERINAQLAAIKPLYASLSPEQKKVADAVLVPQHRGGRFGGRGHGRRTA